MNLFRTQLKMLRWMYQKSNQQFLRLKLLSSSPYKVPRRSRSHKLNLTYRRRPQFQFKIHPISAISILLFLIRAVTSCQITAITCNALAVRLLLKNMVLHRWWVTLCLKGRCLWATSSLWCLKSHNKLLWELRRLKARHQQGLRIKVTQATALVMKFISTTSRTTIIKFKGRESLKNRISCPTPKPSRLLNKPQATLWGLKI